MRTLKEKNGYFEQIDGKTKFVGAKVDPQKEKKERSKKRIDNLVMKHDVKITEALLQNALGELLIFKIVEEKGSDGKVLSRKHVQIIDPEEVRRAMDTIYLNGQSTTGEYFFVSTKTPDTRAAEALFNRTHGKPKETVDVNENVTFSLRGLIKRAEALREQREKQELPAPIDE